ncbi:MAG TPA: hypothetical protein DD490_23705, partial [Acidobacteria bacterium]|nr:hypothetical protein [Acidobacteriota bacterium]
MTRSLVAAGAIARGREAGRLLRSLLARCREDPAQEEAVIPAAWWSVRPMPGEEAHVLFRGAVLVRFRGPREEQAGAAEPLSPELAAALAE